jgi:hypothetical protein
MAGGKAVRGCAKRRSAACCTAPFFREAAPNRGLHLFASIGADRSPVKALAPPALVR